TRRSSDLLAHLADTLPDVAEADDAEALPHEHLRQSLAVAPSAAAQERHVRLEALGRREDECPCDLRGRRLRIAHLGVGHGNAARRERSEVELRVAASREE